MSNFDSSRGSPLHVAVMWLVILVSVGITAAENFRKPDSAGAAASAAAAGESANISIELSGRYVVGTSTLPVSHPEATPKMMAMLDAMAKVPADRLRVAIVAGQLQGDSAARKRIEALASAIAGDSVLRQDADDLLKIYSARAQSLPSENRLRLIGRYGWFGRLALAYGAQPGSPELKAVLAPAVRTLAVLGVSVVLFFAAFAVGLVLCIIAVVFLLQGNVRLAYVPMRGPGVPLVEAFAVYVASFAAIGIIFRRWPLPAGVAGTVLRITIMLAVAVIPIIWPLLRGMRWQEYRQTIGWHTGQGWLREIGIGIVAYIGGLPILALGVVIMTLLSRITGIQPIPHPIVHEIGRSTGLTIQLLLLASVYAPIAEETLFRGVLFSHLRGRFGWLFSTTIVSLIFAALHPQGIAAIPVLFSIAFVLAAIREWRGSILPSMTAHALNNGILLLALTMCLS